MLQLRLEVLGSVATLQELFYQFNGYMWALMSSGSPAENQEYLLNKIIRQKLDPAKKAK